MNAGNKLTGRRARHSGCGALPAAAYATRLRAFPARSRMIWPLPFRDPPFALRPRRWLMAGLVGLAAFVVVGHAIRRAADALLPPPAVEEVTLKLDWYHDHKAEIDTIFIGTSRLFFTLDPRAFDAAAASLGCPTHSFNMALAGLNFRELLTFMKLIRDDPPPKLKLVLFEPRPSPGRDLEEMMSPRRRLTMDADTLLAPVSPRGWPTPVAAKRRHCFWRTIWPLGATTISAWAR